MKLLRALCQTEDAEMRRRACRVLGDYPWQEAEHQVVFEACALLSAHSVRWGRRELATQVTRAGFPDFDLDALFEPLASPAAELARRLDEHEGKTR